MSKKYDMDSESAAEKRRCCKITIVAQNVNRFPLCSICMEHYGAFLHNARSNYRLQ